MSTLYYPESDLSGMVPPDFLLQALDDDNDGVEDTGLWAKIAGQAGDAIDAYLGLRYALPLSAPFPAIVINAARVFTCEMLYKRRGVADEANPWAAQAGQTRTLLKAISLGQSPLSPELNRQDPPASVITQPLSTVPQRGHARNSA